MDLRMKQGQQTKHTAEQNRLCNVGKQTSDDVWTVQ